MLNLPILNVQLHPCHEDWQQMKPTAQGRHCAACSRVVIDFTNATQADLQIARAAAADGRVCGRFREEQLAPPPKLRPRLRRFLVALVLVCGLGLSAREAVAQVKPVLRDNTASNADWSYLLAPLQPLPSRPKTESHVYGMMAERMPIFEGGQERLIAIIQQNRRWPDGIDSIKGKVFVSFTIDEQGCVVMPTITKGLHPKLDAEALRLVQLLDGGWQPGEQNGRPVPVRFTVPITFDSTPAPATSRRKAKAVRLRKGQ